MSTSTMTKALAATTGVLALLLSGAAGVGWIYDRYLSSEVWLARDFDARARSDPSLRALKDNYPDDFQRVRDLSIEGPTDRRLTPAQMDREMFELGQEIMSARVDGVMAAPDDQVAAMIEADRDLVHAFLATNVHLCAQYLRNEINWSTHMPEETQIFMSRSMAAQIIAAHAGEMTPVERDSYTDRDIWALQSAMVDIGMTEEGVLRLLNGALADAEPAQQCDAIAGLLDGLNELEIDQAARIYLYLFSQSQDAESD